jgi:hypothetical protein
VWLALYKLMQIMVDSLQKLTAQVERALQRELGDHIPRTLGWV